MGYFDEFLEKMKAFLKQMEQEKQGEPNEPTVRKFETPWGHGYYYYNISYSPLNSIGGHFSNTSVEKPLSIGDNIGHLENELKILVAKEDYESAAKIRDRLKDLKENYNIYEEKLKELQEKKELAVKAQDYESANRYKKEIDQLTNKVNLEQEND